MYCCSLLKYCIYLLNLVNFSIKTMEMVKNKWEHFGNNFETLSVWITEKEKELSAVETSSSAMDMQINQIKVTCSHVPCIPNPCLSVTKLLSCISSNALWPQNKSFIAM